MEELLKEILTEVKATKVEVLELKTRVDALEKRMTALEDRMTALEDRVTSLEVRMTATENEVKGLYAYIDETVNAAIDRATKEISSVIQELSIKSGITR